MISRKRIILKSEDIASGRALENGGNSKKSNSTSKSSNSSDEFFSDTDAAGLADENTWFSLEQLLNDQITEIINKWSQIDDEIWGKVVCFERNRRIAKVYARSQVLSISGSDGDFDGSRIGLNAFPNFKRDEDTEKLKKSLKSSFHQGFKLKIDELGNIYIKRVGKCGVFIATGEDCLTPSRPPPLLPNSKSTSDLLKLPVQAKKMTTPPTTTFRSLEPNKAQCIFSMRHFLASIAEWSARNPGTRYPPIDFLERFHQQCVHIVQLVRREDETTRRILRHPCWIVVVNIVGLDLLWSRFGYSSMILLNQHQLVNLRSCFVLGSGGEGGGRWAGRQHSKDSDDLYYSGYKAKISSHHHHSHQPKPSSCHSSGKSRNSSSGCQQFAFNHSTPFNFSSHSHHHYNYNNAENNSNKNHFNKFNRNGNQNQLNASVSANNRMQPNHFSSSQTNLKKDYSSRQSLIPRLIAPPNTAAANGRSIREGFQVPTLAQHYKRMARSSTHLHFTSTGGSTNNSSTSEDNGHFSSTSSLEGDLYSSQGVLYSKSSTSSSASSHYSAKLYRSKRRSNSNSSTSGNKNFSRLKSQQNQNNSGSGNYYSRYPMVSSHHSRLYNRNASSERLTAMKKLSSSNIELSSGIFYNVEGDEETFENDDGGKDDGTISGNNREKDSCSVKSGGKG